jgi:protein-tyrosine phosphatase
MSLDRRLNWEGCCNARDLGGLRTLNGRETRWGAVVRSDSLDHLTPAGWSALQAHGIRTIIDLSSDQERQASVTPPVAGLATLHEPLEDYADTAFWQQWRDTGLWLTPLYYQAFLNRFPERCAAVIATIAQAQPGGVLVHCGVGRDRTGLITLLLLSLAGVAPTGIAEDYELSAGCLPLRFAALGEEDDDPYIQECLARENTSARAVILAILASLEVETYLYSGSLSKAELEAVRTRLLERPASSVAGEENSY